MAESKKRIHIYCAEPSQTTTNEKLSVFVLITPTQHFQVTIFKIWHHTIKQIIILSTPYMKMASDFPLDYDGVLNSDDLDYIEDPMFADIPDDIISGETQDQEESVFTVLPTLKLGPMQLSSDETKDEDFLRSVCMETTLDFIDLHFENRGVSRGTSLYMLSLKLTDLQ